MPPEKIPAPPTPEIERPTMNAVEFGAAPQMADPSSNTAMQIRNNLEKCQHSRIENYGWSTYQFRAVELIDSPEEQLSGAAGKHVGTAIPSNVI